MEFKLSFVILFVLHKYLSCSLDLADICEI